MVAVISLNSSTRNGLYFVQKWPCWQARYSICLHILVLYSLSRHR